MTLEELKQKNKWFESQLLFVYNNKRCHACVIEKLPENKKTRFIGVVKDFKIYQDVTHALFNQFGFYAIKAL